MNIWDKATVDRHEAWYRSPKGAFALAREQRLMAHMLSAWQRRSQTMLEIGCGAGHFLEMFYSAGFDVTGVDRSEPMLDRARNRMGNRATLRLGNAEQLPFDDDAFDYVALVTSLECMENREAVLAEAFRVASKGVVIAYLNGWSVYRLELLGATAWQQVRRRVAGWLAARRGLPPPAPGQPASLRPTRWFNLLRICRMIHKVSGKCPTAFRSTLFSPSFFWRGVAPFSLSWAQMLPFGAVSVVRIDLVPMSPTVIALKAPKLSRATGVHAGAVSMEQYPQTQEK